LPRRHSKDPPTGERHLSAPLDLGLPPFQHHPHLSQHPLLLLHLIGQNPVHHMFHHHHHQHPVRATQRLRLLASITQLHHLPALTKPPHQSRAHTMYSFHSTRMLGRTRRFP